MMVNKLDMLVCFPLFQSLSMLLNGTPFAFVIDLAALASRREYLKLDKWLTDKIREHGVCFSDFLADVYVVLSILPLRILY